MLDYVYYLGKNMVIRVMHLSAFSSFRVAAKFVLQSGLNIAFRYNAADKFVKSLYLYLWFL